MTEEELATAAVAAREARFEFGERLVTKKENSKEDE